MSTICIGVISDTHSLLRDSALDALDGCEHIVHAGDIGNAMIIPRLEEIAAVTAVRGNIDKGTWADCYPTVNQLSIGNYFLYVLHNIKELDVEPKGLFDIVVFGHSHKSLVEYRDDVLFFNPGSAGPRRFKLPISLGMIYLTEQSIKTELVYLDR